MHTCNKDYSHHGQRYLAGKDYKIQKAEIESHEKYFGEKLWDGAEKETPAPEATPDAGAEATPDAKAKKDEGKK